MSINQSTTKRTVVGERAFPNPTIASQNHDHDEQNTRMPVPKQEYESTLQAISQAIQNLYETKVLPRYQFDNPDQGSNIRTVLNQYQTTLEGIFTKLVYPVEYDEYCKLYMKYDYDRMRHILDSTADMDGNGNSIATKKELEFSLNSLDDSDYSDDSTTSSTSTMKDDLSDNDESSIEDEDELIDQEAVIRVKALREQVRITAKRTIEQRNHQLTRITQIVQKQLHDIHLFFDTLDDPMKDGDEEKEYQQDKILQDEQLKSSLTLMMNSLQQLKSELPDCLDAIKENVETIEENLWKQNKSLSEKSRVERAILSRVDRNTNSINTMHQWDSLRENTKGMGSMSFSTPNITTGEYVDPETRFAFFISRA